MNVLRSIREPTAAAFAHGAGNSTNTVFDAKRLIGRKPADSILQADVKLWPFKVLSGRGSKNSFFVAEWIQNNIKVSFCDIPSKGPKMAVAFVGTPTSHDISPDKYGHTKGTHLD